MEYILNSLQEAQETLNKTLNDESFLTALFEATDCLTKTFEGDGRVMSCGNGGSLCDSMHFAEELTGRYRKDRRPLGATSIMDPSHMSCVANDFGYEHIFSRFVEGWGKKGDTLLAISTSGNSENVIKAVESAKSKGMNTIGLLGKDGGRLKDMVDFSLIVPSNITDRIQEVHIKCIHIMIEGIERKLFPENYL
ncbi:MAG: D-sedoheptulose 7-phosphate isomerase [Bacteriovoracaceae bacterium]|nr:D-sedoheptulose 7-phosphate isomerase [Bacteriovoracaceae bacterium]